MTHTENFLSESAQILAGIDTSQVDAVVDIIAETRDRGGRLFFAGSGGGAAHASHAACDFRKIGGIESYCVTDNVAELTARINDDGWESSYANYLAGSSFDRFDCLFVFSVGGGSIEKAISLNLVRAIEYAAGIGAKVVGAAGRGGGSLAKVSSACVLIPSDSTFQVEGFQAVIWHLIVSHPKIAVNKAKWESVEPRPPRQPDPKLIGYLEEKQ